MRACCGRQQLSVCSFSPTSARCQRSRGLCESVLLDRKHCTQTQPSLRRRASAKDLQAAQHICIASAGAAPRLEVALPLQRYWLRHHTTTSAARSRHI